VSGDDLPADLVAWAEGRAGGTMAGATRQQGGARKEAWWVDFDTARGRRELFLRYDRSDPARTLDPWTLHREASVYLALQGTEVRVPAVLDVHPTHQAMLAERVVGENWFSRITDPDEATATAQDFMRQLAALHRLDPATLALPHLAAATTIPDAIAWELDEWDRVIEQRGGEPDPQLAFGLAWLRRNVPDVDSPVVLVQGDTGPGNFLYADGQVLAVVDWELAHLGDPMDDIAWLTLRCCQEPFPDLPARLREYEELVGGEVDDHRVRYHQVAAETKMLVLAHRPAGRDGGGGAGGADLGNGLIYGVLHRRLWFEAVAAFLDLDLPALEPIEGMRTDHDWLYDGLLEQLRELVVPRIDDPLAKARTKGFARVLKYLQELQRTGPAYDEQERAGIEALLSRRFNDLAGARRALLLATRAGELDERAYLLDRWARVQADNELLRSASGALADRHWPELR
jgi:aminoglycoside phosphotransferase (APT) family kinase protein